jgi:uncharacterized protein with GYD domain
MKSMSQAAMRWRNPLRHVWLFALFALSSQAHAQLTDKPARMAADVAAMLQAMGVSMFIAAVLWVAYKMIFAGAGFRDVSNIAWGGVLAGAAAAIAGWAMAA